MRGLILSVLAGTMVLGLGCRQRPAPQAPVAQNPSAPTDGKKEMAPPVVVKGDQPKTAPPVQPEPPKKIASGVNARRIEIIEMEQGLQQLGLAYKAHEITNRKGPAKVEDFGNGISPALKQEIQDGYVKVIWNAVAGPEPGNEIYAYEADPDIMGRRVVLMADGRTVKRLNDAEFKKTPKAKAR